MRGDNSDFLRVSDKGKFKTLDAEAMMNISRNIKNATKRSKVKGTKVGVYTGDIKERASYRISI